MESYAEMSSTFHLIDGGRRQFDRYLDMIHAKIINWGHRRVTQPQIRYRVLNIWNVYQINEFGFYEFPPK